MSTDGWLDAYVANAAFKDVQFAVMYFDHAQVPKLERVETGDHMSEPPHDI